MGRLVEARRKLEAELYNALSNGEFELFYQPFHNVLSTEICAFEALLRWRHPVRGLVQPDQFIPVLEQTGLIVPLGEWVLREACAQAATWPEHISVSVNLSPVQFRKTSPVKAVVDALAASGLAASRLELEITETVLMRNSEGTLTALHQLRELGTRISMDDFGTGYSSLSYLRSFPFDKIKIDRSFINDLTHKPDGIAIVRAIAALGTSLELATTAEGVETWSSLRSCVRKDAPRCRVSCSVHRCPRSIGRGIAASSVRLRARLMISPQAAPERFFVDIPGDGNIFHSQAI